MLLCYMCVKKWQLKWTKLEILPIFFYLQVKFANARLQERLGDLQTLQDELNPCLQSLDDLIATGKLK